ncbi:MAG: hypothetical protein WBE86_05865 [Candidatus Acidiferrales bacterium]
MNSQRTRKYACQALRRWPYQIPESLTPEVSIANGPDIFNGHDSLIPYMLSGHAIETFRERTAWLHCEFNDDNSHPKNRVRATELIKNSQLAIQLVAPIGLDYTTVFVIEECPSEAPRPTVELLPPMKPTAWSRLIGYSASSLEELKTVAKGVGAAFNSQVTRLMNPLYFLELGMESNHPYLRTFLWVTGLDALLMANNKAQFEQRLGNLCGMDSPISPSIPTFGQPRHRVGEVAADLYEFRSIIAHGRPIDARFREHHELISPDGQPSLHCMYHEFLQESALCLLTAAMKKVFIGNLAEIVARPTDWREYLKTPHL